MRFFLFGYFLFSTAVAFGQYCTFEELNSFKNIDTIERGLGYNVQVSDAFKRPFFLALSFYPELKNVHIKLKESKIKTTLNARPTVLSLLFRNKKKRRYIIRVNNSKKDSSILFKDAPVNAQVGLLGHELAHFKDYNEKSIFGISKRLFAYSSKIKKSQFEKEIDLVTIQKGLGWQLYDWSFYVLNSSKASTKYKKFKESTYLTPKEIELLLN